RIRTQPDGQVSYRGLFRSLSDVEIGLPGEHQRANAALAMAAVEIADRKGLWVDDRAMRLGIGCVSWEARGEVLMRKPTFLLDGAHNPAGVRTLCRTLKNDFSYRRLILIFAALADKDYSRMLRTLAVLADVIILPPLATGRAANPKRLACELEGAQVTVMETDSVCEALKKALGLAKKNDLICAAGSLYLAGEIKQLFARGASCGKCLGEK
ncbi:MAG: cyanophycin synthetase, partial [Smithellaceae bacterium]